MMANISLMTSYLGLSAAPAKTVLVATPVFMREMRPQPWVRRCVELRELDVVQLVVLF
jgi:hypothetical protein